MEEGTIASWTVKEGDAVTKGDVLGEIEIEKLTNELLSEEDGIILKLIAEVGETLKCGEPILIFGAAGETLDASTPPGVSSKTAALPEVDARPSAAPAKTAATAIADYSAQAQITPKALQLAEELGVDYHYVKGTGRFGMVTREDIRDALSQGNAPQAKPAVRTTFQAETRPMTQMQQAIAKAMDASLRTTAQTTISMDIDATEMVKAYQAHKQDYARRGEKLTYTAILVKIVAAALSSHPLLRTVIEKANLVTRGEINVGIAVDVADGLVVPNIKHADQKNLHQIASELADLGQRAAGNTLTKEDITNGVFTISNLGMFGIKYFTPVLNPGESALLGVGAIQEVPTVRDGGIFVKPILNLSLTHDHRVVNGAPGARFLQTIQQLVHDCEQFFKE
jgi:pyruvate dehydrogenase E2 component (dihydrolipoamide acetyltransferase)